jgi:hypothetical protein
MCDVPVPTPYVRSRMDRAHLEIVEEHRRILRAFLETGDRDRMFEELHALQAKCPHHNVVLQLDVCWDCGKNLRERINLFCY